MATTDSNRVWYWCVCGCETNLPWELVQDGLVSRDAAAGWVAENHLRYPQYTGWHVDWYVGYYGAAEDGAPPAATYYFRNPDGSLSECRDGRRVFFCD